MRMKSRILWLSAFVFAALFARSLTTEAPSPLWEVPTSAPERASPPASPVHGRKGVYLTAYAAADAAFLENVLLQSAKFGLNCVVIDVKNNEGDVCYRSQVPLAWEIGAVRPVLDLPALVAELHARGFYVIARQVVFYDPRLAGHLGHSSPWVSPASPWAWSYNLALAEEVEAMGVDEIQFDYIRFPDDGPIGPDYSERCAAVEGFLARARKALSIPISVDVYGRVMWPWNAQKIDPIGQHLEGMAPYVDVVSPMLYPSHFVEEELKSDPYGTVRRALLCGRGRVAVPLRPYLQAFIMAIPPGMAFPQYILAQILAAEESGADGYLFWNPRADYSGLWEALARRDLAGSRRAP